MSDGVGGGRHTFIPDLMAAAPIPERGILSLTLSDEDGIRLVVFAFAPGEELSSHTAARPAIVHVLSGEAEIEADGDVYAATAGSWLRMAMDTPHAIRARTGMVMALYLLPGPAGRN